MTAALRSDPSRQVTVYVYSPAIKAGRSSKFRKCLNGPWIVVKRKSSLNYEIKNRLGKSASFTLIACKRRTMPMAGKSRILRKERARPQFEDRRARNVETPRKRKSTPKYLPQDLSQVTHRGLRNPTQTSESNQGSTPGTGYPCVRPITRRTA
jgi:hypothetical protein